MHFKDYFCNYWQTKCVCLFFFFFKNLFHHLWLSKILLFSDSVMSDFLGPHELQASLSFTFSRSLFKLMPIELVMPSNHLILCRPLLLLPSIFPSIRVFSNQFALRIRWPKFQRFSFSIRPANEYSGLISFRMWNVVAEPWKMLGFLASGGEEFSQGPEMRLDRSELLCNKVLLNYKRDRESFWHNQKGAERVPPC